jgi:cell division protein ZipA
MEILTGLVVIFVLRFLYQSYKKNQQSHLERQPRTLKKEPGIGNLDTLYHEEIIAVRKREKAVAGRGPHQEEAKKGLSTLVLHVMAEKNKPFLGYDLLQILLSQGLKFGEMNIFHRYQETNGKGPCLFSIASALEPGTFNIHQMGSHSYPGVTLFMRFSGSVGIDKERFSLMLSTAEELSQTLQGQLLNDGRELISEKNLDAFRQMVVDSIDAAAA